MTCFNRYQLNISSLFNVSQYGWSLTNYWPLASFPLIHGKCLWIRKNMLDSYYCIVILFLEKKVNTLWLKQILHLYLWYIRCIGFKNASYRVIYLHHSGVTELCFLFACSSDYVIFVTQSTKPCINRTWIALLIKGLVPVKTWLLISCDMAFYGIKSISH